MNLYHTGLSELYKEIEALGDPLTGISDRIDFEKIRPILSDLYENDTEKGGRPNYDPILHGTFLDADSLGHYLISYFIENNTILSCFR